MKSISLPLASIGHGVTVTFGHTLGLRNREHQLQSLESEWLRPFLEETRLAGADAAERIRLTLELAKEGNVIRARGDISYEPELECVRSLTLFRQAIQVPISALFMDNSLLKPRAKSGHDQHALHGDAAAGDEEALSEEDLDTYYFAKNALDLDELLLDVMQTGLPDLPLCRPDCRGMCADCGVVLNDRTTCGRVSSEAAPARAIGHGPCPHAGTFVSLN